MLSRVFQQALSSQIRRSSVPTQLKRALPISIQNLQPLLREQNNNHGPSTKQGQRRGAFFSALNPFDTSLRKQHNVRKTMDIPPEDVFEVIAHCEKYGEFLPFCVDCKIRRRLSPNVFEAQMTVGFRIFSEAYVSRVTITRPRRVEIHAVESAHFKRLDSVWTILPGKTPTSCVIDFMVDFEVHGQLHAHAINIFFEEVAKTQVQAFEDRARKIYLEKLQKQTRLNARVQAPPRKGGRAQEEISQAPSVTSPLTSSSSNLPMKRSDVLHRLSAEEVKYLTGLFEKYAPDGRMHMKQFSAALQDVKNYLSEMAEVADDAALQMALFTSFSFDRAEGEEDREWISLEEFLTGAYLVSKASVADTAARLFAVIDANGDGTIDRNELTSAMQRRIKVVERFIPKLIKHKMKEAYYALEKQAEDKQALVEQLNECSEAILASVEGLVEQVQAEIPLAVDQILSSTKNQEIGAIDFESWTQAWEKHPELIELLTISGMAKVAHWASALTFPPDK